MARRLNGWLPIVSPSKTEAREAEWCPFITAARPPNAVPGKYQHAAKPGLLCTCFVLFLHNAPTALRALCRHSNRVLCSYTGNRLARKGTTRVLQKKNAFALNEKHKCGSLTKTNTAKCILTNWPVNTAKYGRIKPKSTNRSFHREQPLAEEQAAVQEVYAPALPAEGRRSIGRADFKSIGYKMSEQSGVVPSGSAVWERKISHG